MKKMYCIVTKELGSIVWEFSNLEDAEFVLEQFGTEKYEIKVVENYEIDKENEIEMK